MSVTALTKSFVPTVIVCAAAVPVDDAVKAFALASVAAEPAEELSAAFESPLNLLVNI